MARRRRQSGAGATASGELPSVELARRLGTLLTELGLTEIDVTVGEIRVRLQRGVVAPTAPALAPAASSVERPAGHTAEIESASGVTIEAPMVGTFYRASSPTITATGRQPLFRASPLLAGSIRLSRPGDVADPRTSQEQAEHPRVLQVLQM